MSTLGDLLAEHTMLPGTAVDHLHAVVGEWQLLADLSFADYLMWVRRDDAGLVCVAQVRPNTAPTVLLADAVGTKNEADEMPVVTEAFLSGHIGRESDAAERHATGVTTPPSADGSWLNVEAVPVRQGNHVVAVLTHQTALADQRKASPLERAYLDCARNLLHMLSEGTFPNVGDVAMSRSSPRVGDGFIRLDGEGVVAFASPNAISAYHRMGLAAELEGHNLVSVTRPLISDPFEAQELTTHVRDSLDGGSSMRMEVDAGGAAVLLRTLPLVVHGAAAGAAVLIRDVTEVKRRDRALLSKDATIREIHHRVKNNLQTVAALLRLQARRSHSAEAESALYDAMSRVQSIAAVHEILSQSFDEAAEFDQVADKILQTVGDVASTRGGLRAKRQGSFGLVPAKVATSLSLIMTELCQNALEHGLADRAGEVYVRPTRNAQGGLVLDVVDQGAGLPEGFVMGATNSLGTSIVTTLVADLGGEFTLFNNPGAPGATSRVIVPAETLSV